ncbi:MAG: MOP flippase family protein [Bryobacteraceae bacterium]|jgi:PST family polysaccharide transporter
MAILRNVSWTGTGQVVRQGLQFLVVTVLARLLAPADFGLLALATVFTGFAAMFSDFGMSAAVIYRQDASSAELDFAFWLNIAVGMLLTSVCIAVAPVIGTFYGDPRVIPLVRAVALTFAIGSIETLPQCLLQKAFRFRALTLVDCSAATLAGAVAVLMALHGFGVWSLVAQVLATTAVSVTLKWILVSWRPGLRFHWRDGTALWRFGTNLLGFNAVNYWCRNGDNLLIGRFCGAAELGLYSRAYSLMLLPVTQVQGVLSSVMFPTLAALRDSKEAFRRTYLMACQSISLVAFPVMLGMLVEADDLIHVLWGPRWTGVVPIIRVLSIAGLGNAVATTVGWIYTATGRTNLMFRWSLVTAPVMLGSFAFGLRWGAYGVAVAYVAVFYPILWYPTWTIALRLIDLPFSLAMRNLLKPLAASSAMAMCVFALRSVMPSRMPSVRLAATTVVGFIVYALLVALLRIPALISVRRQAVITFRSGVVSSPIGPLPGGVSDHESPVQVRTL